MAIATPEAQAALGIVRLSGPDAIAIANRVFRGKDLTQQSSHTIHYGWIYDDGEPVDEVMVAVMRAPRTFTGEDLVEITAHGSPLILRRILRLLQKHGARLARPGEFTLRAFLHGKIDLVQAEAINDLIHAISEKGQQLALKALRGEVSGYIRQLRQKLLDLTSLLELELDFAEEDVEFASRDQLAALMNEVKQTLEQLIRSYSTGQALQQGIRVAIVGEPNAGKSTLLNALVQEERAIVSDIPGTTRDYIEETFVLDGWMFRLVDTAGLRETTDPVEQIGVARTREQMQRAHLILYVYDVTAKKPDEVADEVNKLRQQAAVITVANKIDLMPEAPLPPLEPVIPISARTGQGLDQLKKQLVDWAQRHFSAEGILITSERQYEALKQAYEALLQAQRDLEQGLPTDLVAASLRAVIDYLGEVTGEITPDDILGTIFSRFCIGK